MAVRVLAIIVGAATVMCVVDAATRTFLLPRASQVWLSNSVVRGVGRIFKVIASPARSYEFRDRVLAVRPAVSLLALQTVWMGLVFAGFAGILWGADHQVGWADAARESGSALFTLGFATPAGAPLVLVYAEAFLGMALMALLISYLPTIYGAFQKREFMVAKLAVRSGFGRQPWRALGVAFRTGTLAWQDANFWPEWENWFVDIAESHTSLAIVSFYRSPDPANHWVSAARQVLDMAAIRISLIDAPIETVGPHVAIRSGTLALRQLASAFGLHFDPDPAPTDPIHITRSQFDEACVDLEQMGVPIVDDREAAWVAFAGWRVNYDQIIEQLAVGFMAPPSPWDSLAGGVPPMPGELIVGSEDAE